MDNHIKKKKNGFGLIEILLVVGVGMATFLGIEQYLSLSLRAAIGDSYQTEALYRAKANLEQARAVRDEDWALISSLILGNQYNFAANGATPEKWIAQMGTRGEGRYTVWFTISQVQRDANSDIVVIGGTIDPNTLKINSNVSWSENGATKLINVSEYLVNFK